MHDPYGRLDTWELLKGHVYDAVPGLAERVRELEAEPWRTMTASEAQLAAVMVACGLDGGLAAARRRGRSIQREILAELGMREGRVAEADGEAPDAWDRLSAAARRRLTDTVAWIGAAPPSESLAAVSGPQAAVALVHSHAKALPGLRAHRWLAAMGYPIAVPDTARLRPLVRMEWLQLRPKEKAAEAKGLALIEELARETGSSPASWNAVLGVFAGAADSADRDAARCLPTPRCAACPLAARCPHHARERKRGATEARTLTAMVRPENRPRERLQRDGPGALTDEELLAILLRTGSGRENALDLAARLLKRACNIEALARMSVAEMGQFHGLGAVKAVTVKAALELARRIAQTPVEPDTPMASSRAVFELLRPRFLGARKEHFVVLHLNTRLCVFRQVDVSTGTLNQSLVHPREVFTEAIRDSAHAVIFAHNHPSGDPAPSREDIAITQKLVKAGDIVGIRVLDHIVVGRDAYYSFADEGKLG